MIRRFCAIAAAALGLATASAPGNVNLELRPVAPVHYVEDVIEVGLFAVSDSDEDQMVRGLEVILLWDAAYMELNSDQPVVNNGPYPWLMSGFYDDSAADGLNNDWDDGNAFYQAVGNFETEAWATPEGLLVTTFRFDALDITPGTLLDIPPSFGLYTQTRVYGEEVGVPVTGTLSGADIEIRPLVDWGHLTLSFLNDMCGLLPGQFVTVELSVSDLLAPINGVQVLVAFPPDVMSFIGAVPGDGMSSPWNSAVEVHESVDAGVLTYAVLLLDGGSAADAVVGELVFRFEPDQLPAAAELAILASSPPLVTKLTEAANGSSVIPDLAGPIAVAGPGDINTDGVLDFADFEGFADCMSGPDIAVGGEVCCRVDLDPDGDVDLLDLAGLQRAVNAP